VSIRFFGPLTTGYRTLFFVHHCCCQPLYLHRYESACASVKWWPQPLVRYGNSIHATGWLHCIRCHGRNNEMKNVFRQIASLTVLTLVRHVAKLSNVGLYTCFEGCWMARLKVGNVSLTLYCGTAAAALRSVGPAYRWGLNTIRRRPSFYPSMHPVAIMALVARWSLFTAATRSPSCTYADG
jgi:hypothetical protein